MMKGRRILAVVLSLVMVVSLGMASTVYAAAPITFEGATSVLFDQSFGGLGSAAGAPDFTIYGSNWTYASHFIMNAVDKEPYVQTKDSYDLSDASGFEFEVKMEVTSNSNTITLPAGYTIQWHHNVKNVILFKDGVEVARSGYIYLYDADTVYNVKYVDGLWTISATSKTASVSFTYEDASNPTFNGKFKVGCSYTGHYTVYYMKLTKFANTTTVNHWKYEKEFSSADTLDTLTEEGFTFSSTDFTVSSSGIKSVHNDRTLTFRPYGKDFSGSYYFETAIGRSMNYYSLDFNHSANGYYRIRIPKASTDNNIYLYKYDASADKTYTLAKQAFTNTTNGITTTYKVKVLENDDGSVSITVDAVYGSTIIPTFTYTDTDADTVVVSTTTTDSETGESVTTTENVDTGAPLTSGKIRVIWGYCGDNSYFKYLKAFSLVTDSDKSSQDATVYNKIFADNTFTTADTVEALTNEGYTIDSAATIADDGIVTNDSSVTYAQDMGDNYSYEVDMYRLYNGSSITFDKYDSKNYYIVETNYGSVSNKYIRIRKIAAGSEVTDLTQSETSAFGDQTYPSIDYGYAAVSNYKINVSTVNGTKTITLTYKSGSQGVTRTLTMVDPDPIDGAGITMSPGYNGRLVSFKATGKYADGEYPEILTAQTLTNSATTVDELAAEGYTVPSSATLGSSYLTIGTSNFDYTAENLGGNYKMSTKVYRGYNGSNIYFDWDGTNYYRFTYKNHGTASENYVKLLKVKDGKTYTVWSLADALGLDNCSTLSSANKGNYVVTDFDVTATTDADTGNKIFTINYKPSSGTARNFTYVDYYDDADAPEGQIADGGAPVSGNKFRIKHDNAGRVYNFNVTKFISSSWYSGEEPLFVGNFSNSYGNILSLSNGAIYFEYPTALLGDYKVIATLHENNEMTGIKVISPLELYAGKVKLFTVTDAANAKVRVYFFDGEETLNRITEVYELN